MDLSTAVHGDGFLSEGPAEHLMKTNLALEQNFQVKTAVTGPDPGHQLEARVLNRVIRRRRPESLGSQPPDM